MKKLVLVLSILFSLNSFALTQSCLEEAEFDITSYVQSLGLEIITSHPIRTLLPGETAKIEAKKYTNTNSFTIYIFYAFAYNSDEDKNFYFVVDEPTCEIQELL